jgi:hypothetical protein
LNYRLSPDTRIPVESHGNYTDDGIDEISIRDHQFYGTAAAELGQQAASNRGQPYSNLSTSSQDYSRARTTRKVKILNLSLKIEISDFHVFRHYVSLKFPFSAKSSAS